MRKLLTLASVLIVVLAAIASISGIVFPNLYKDNLFVKTAWLANDWVTLTIVIPALLATIILAKKTGPKAELVWIGLLSYFFYNYAFYLFGAVFNSMFLLYVAIDALSFFSILTFLANQATTRLNFEFRTIKWVTAFLLVLITMLCLVEIPPIIQFISGGKVPELNLKTNHPTNIVYALDLTFVVPAMLIAAVLNFKKNGWGGVISVVMLVKAATYGLVLIAGTILQMLQGVSDPLLPVWIFIATGGGVGLYFILKKLRIAGREGVTIAP